VRSESNVLRRPAKRQSRAAGVSPPWEWSRAVDGKPQLTGRRSHSARAAGVSPPWQRNASAMARVSFPERVHSRTTAGSRQPLLVALAVVIADVRFSTASMPVFPTAGLRQPLLVHGIGRPKNNDIRGAQTLVYKSGGCQPVVGGQNRIRIHDRYSSADRRRCVRIAVAFAFLGATGGLRPPLLYCVRMSAGETATCAVHKRSFTRAAGVIPPCKRFVTGERLISRKSIASEGTS
jgi:hypothetical protein